MSMSRHPRLRCPARYVPAGILLLLLLLSAAAIAAADLEDVIEAARAKVELAQASQSAIDQVVEESRALEAEYKQVVKQLDGLLVYNEYLARQIANQDEELARLQESIAGIGTVERQIMPLMIRMLDGLEQFIALDLPFLPEERAERVARLRSLMERADVSAAEKFRSLTEAFQIENDYGRTIETYKSTLQIEGVVLEVDVLRLGRVGLYYQTNDGSATGWWDRRVGAWAPLSGGTARSQVRKGIRMARKQVAPEFLLLRVPAGEAGS